VLIQLPFSPLNLTYPHLISVDSDNKGSYLVLHMAQFELQLMSEAQESSDYYLQRSSAASHLALVRQR
jgi:hypothetical protein